MINPDYAVAVEVECEPEFDVMGYAEVFFGLGEAGGAFIVKSPMPARFDYSGDRLVFETEPLSSSFAQGFSLKKEKLSRFSAPSLSTGTFYQRIGFTFGIEGGGDEFLSIVDERVVLAFDSDEGSVSLCESDGHTYALGTGEEDREDFCIDFLQDVWEGMSEWPHLAEWQARVAHLLSDA